MRCKTRLSERHCAKPSTGSGILSDWLEKLLPVVLLRVSYGPSATQLCDCLQLKRLLRELAPPQNLKKTHSPDMPSPGIAAWRSATRSCAPWWSAPLSRLAMSPASAKESIKRWMNGERFGTEGRTESPEFKLMSARERG